MLLKRKRPSSELCSSPAAAAAALPMDVPAHVHSRTFKRHRDSRPSDNDVHQRTLSLLYSAQQQQQRPPPQLQQHPHHHGHHPAAQPPHRSPPNDQQSLHRFWNIPSGPSSAASSPSLLRLSQMPAHCEDCGAGLAGDSDDGHDMEVDGLGLDDAACGACGKHVCFSCSISNMGDQKRCLQCAGRRVWVGGIGWTNAGISVC